MNTATNVSAARRTPDEIALDLTMYRSRIRADLETYAVADTQLGGEISFSQQLIRTIGSAQRYVAHYMGQGSLPNTTTSALDFVKKRPLLTGVAVSAAVGIALAAGPKRIFGWVAKIAAIWRVASALRS